MSTFYLGGRGTLQLTLILLQGSTLASWGYFICIGGPNLRDLEPEFPFNLTVSGGFKRVLAVPKCNTDYEVIRWLRTLLVITAPDRIGFRPSMEVL